MAVIKVINNFGYNAGGWRVEKHPRYVADLTGYHGDDIIGFGSSGVYTALNNGDGTFQNPQRVINNFGYNAGGWRVEKHPRYVKDILGTDTADLVGFGNAGVYIAFSNGDGTFQNPQRVVNNFGYNAGGWRVEKHPRYLADLTGNSNLDIIGFGNAGVYIAFNNGDGTFQNPQRVINNFGYNAGGWRVEKHPRYVADLTGDGSADIIGFGHSGVYVALNNGDGTFQPVQKVSNSFGVNRGWQTDRHPRYVADLTGDGSADIIGFGNDGVYVAFNNGDGTFQSAQQVIDNFGYNAGGWRVEKYPRGVSVIRDYAFADIIGFGHSGVYASINNGNATFQAATKMINAFGYSSTAGGWRVEKHPRFFADVSNNNYVADVVGFADDGVYIGFNVI